MSGEEMSEGEMS